MKFVFDASEPQNSSDESLSKSVVEVGLELTAVAFSACSQCQRSQCSNGSQPSLFSLLLMFEMCSGNQCPVKSLFDACPVY